VDIRFARVFGKTAFCAAFVISFFSAPMLHAKDANPKLVWQANFEDNGEKFTAITKTIDDAPDHRAKDQVRMIPNCAKTKASKNHCVEVTLQKPVYDPGGEIKIKYNVNGEVDLDGYRGTTATLHYRFYVADGIDWRRQGKLPGLSSLPGAFGGDAPFAPFPDRWSVRLMWLDIGPEKGHPLPSMYLYDQRRAKSQSGEHNKGTSELQSGRWHDAAIYVQLNEVGQDDGRAELWLDGQLMACRTGLTFRNTDSEDAKIRQLAFHNYYGGSAKNPDQFPDKPVTMKFDDFAVYDGRNTPSIPTEAQCSSQYSDTYLNPKPKR
jgi:hypothetical protein